MIVKAYLPRLLKICAFSFCAALGILSYDKPVLFSLVQIATLVTLTIICFRNINITGVCIILLFTQFAIDSFFTLMQNNLAYKLIAYCITAYVLYYLAGDIVQRIVVVFFVVTSFAEVYWAVTSYNAPNVFFYFYKAAIYMLCRFLLFYRAHFTTLKLKRRAKVTLLDNHLVKLHGHVALLQCAMILEYLIRHLTPLQPLLVYSIYEYVMHAYALVVLWYVINDCINDKASRILQA